MSEMVKVTVEVRKDHYNTLKYGVKHWPENYDENEKAIANGTEVKQGYWIENAPEYQNIDPPYICSECGNMHLRKTNYCDQCGARMIESQESEVNE